MRQEESALWQSLVFIIVIRVVFLNLDLFLSILQLIFLDICVLSHTFSVDIDFDLVFNGSIIFQHFDLSALQTLPQLTCPLLFDHGGYSAAWVLRHTRVVTCHICNALRNACHHGWLSTVALSSVFHTLLDYLNFVDIGRFGVAIKALEMVLDRSHWFPFILQIRSHALARSWLHRPDIWLVIVRCGYLQITTLCIQRLSRARL